MDIRYEHLEEIVCRQGKHLNMNGNCLSCFVEDIVKLKPNFCCTLQKKKGMFHHSSFLAGGATLAAGRLVVEHGDLKVLIHRC